MLFWGPTVFQFLQFSYLVILVPEIAQSSSWQNKSYPHQPRRGGCGSRRTKKERKTKEDDGGFVARGQGGADNQENKRENGCQRKIDRENGNLRNIERRVS